MSNKKIIFRADGNSTTGLGHLYRLFALVEMYKDDYEFVFVTKESSTLKVVPENYNTQLIPDEISVENEPKWLSEKYNSLEYIIIADGYQFTSRYQKVLKQKGFFLMYIDDLTTEYMYADVVINHSPNCSEKDFVSEKYTQYALGTAYAMLRPKFIEAATTNRISTIITNAFVCFGGADQYDLSLKAVKALLLNKTIKKIHVVLGGAYRHQGIYDLDEKVSNLYLHKNLDEASLCNLMKSCQIAIVPSSTILYEICSIKMPVLSGYYVDNQKNIYASLIQKKVVFEGGDFRNYTVFDFQNKINNILKNTEINTYLTNQQQLFDGKNKQRFLGLLNKHIVACRLAVKEDLLLVYGWSNDKLVRANSYHTELIKLEDHSKWFLKKISNNNTLFLIIEVNGQPAGIVRFEIDENKAVVGIVVSKEFRGQKLASYFLEEGSKKYFKKFEKPILAYIKKENIASVKSFEKAGYLYFADDIICESSSYVYKLEKNHVAK